MIKIKNNFLTTEEYNKLNEVFLSQTFPWNFINGKTHPSITGLEEFQFIHLFYDCGIVSNYFNLIQPFIDKLKPKSLYKVKANLNVYNSVLKEYDSHVDILNFKGTTGVYYLNTNDGYTRIGKKKIMSESNKIVLFNATQKHAGTNCTNSNYRIVLNFNYV
mgnify:FL=1